MASSVSLKGDSDPADAHTVEIAIAPPINGTCHCGAVRFTLIGDPGTVTACNCTLCCRYGALWAYDFENERITVEGVSSAYTRIGKADPALEIRFCATCACVVCWRGLRIDSDGRRRMAVNLRLASQDTVSNLPVEHFDGFDTFDDLPLDGKCVKDLWF
jgi:hypothetical protein